MLSFEAASWLGEAPAFDPVGSGLLRFIGRLPGMSLQRDYCFLAVNLPSPRSPSFTVPWMVFLSTVPL